MPPAMFDGVEAPAEQRLRSRGRCARRSGTRTRCGGSSGAGSAPLRARRAGSTARSGAWPGFPLVGVAHVEQHVRGRAALGVDRAHLGDACCRGTCSCGVPRFGSGRGELAQLLVVGLAGRRALERVDDDEALRAPCTRRATRGSARRARRRRSCWPSRACTSATTISPHRSSGTPTTTQSNTSGCERSASSTSSGYTFSPPVLMHADPRPSRRIVPSASTVA